MSAGTVAVKYNSISLITIIGWSANVKIYNCDLNGETNYATPSLAALSRNDVYCSATCRLGGSRTNAYFDCQLKSCLDEN